MRYRYLGTTGVQVSVLGYGTMAFGGDVDVATAAALFARCRDAGINHFDCADVYTAGEAERVLGKLIADARDELIITSKAYFPTSPEPNARGASRRHLVQAVEASLRRLGTDRIDIFYVHRHDDHTALEDTLRTLDLLVRQGKILYPALSNFSAWQTVKAIELARRLNLVAPVCIQPMYNLAKRQAEVEILPMAQAEQLGVLPYNPLGGGLLAGKYGRERRPEHARLIDNSMYATRYGAAHNFELAERFVALADELGRHPATLALAWVASHPAVTAPLLGARNLEQLEPLLAAADLELDETLRQRVSALSPEPPPATDRNEERTAHDYVSRTRAGR
jgi:aryl-alcohol dehydrogenase-like predicted oxidoreductase